MKPQQCDKTPNVSSIYSVKIERELLQKCCVSMGIKDCILKEEGKLKFLLNKMALLLISPSSKYSKNVNNVHQKAAYVYILDKNVWGSWETQKKQTYQIFINDQPCISLSQVLYAMQLSLSSSLKRTTTRGVLHFLK